MKRIGLLLLLTTSIAAAEPKINNIHPQMGLTFAPTLVTIEGTNLVAPGTNCVAACNGTCAVKVFFGAKEASVVSATPETIVVTAPAQREGMAVNVRIGAAAYAGEFYYSSGSVIAREEYTRYLLPLTTVWASGAGGSQWMTRYMVHNGLDDGIQLAGPLGQMIMCPPMPTTLGGHDSMEMEVMRRDGADGAFIYVPNAADERVMMALRVRDVSRVAQGFGTEIPMVPDRDFRKTVHLIGVPTDSRYRATLRIYGDTSAPMRANVRVFAEDSSALIEERSVDLSGIVTTMSVEFPEHPAYTALDPLSNAVRAAGARVRIAVTSESGEPLWALLSITNNETQQVTTIAP